MRKFTLALALLASTFSPAATTVTAKLVMPNGAAQVKGTYVKFQLLYCGQNVPKVIGTGIIPATTQNIYPDASGNVLVSLYGNDVITCGAITGNTRWRVTTYVDNVAGPSADYNIEGTSFDLNYAIPVTVAPVVQAPTGDDTYIRLDGGNISSTTMFLPIFAAPPPLGNTVPNTVDGTTITAHTRFVGNLTGNVQGNVVGNLTGNVTGNVTGSASTATTAATATHALNLPADLATQSGTSPAAGKFTSLTVTGQITAGSGALKITTADGHLDATKLTGMVPAASIPATVIQAGSITGCEAPDGASYGTCSVSMTWGTAFADSNYRVSCIGIGITNPRAVLQGITSKTTTGVTIQIATMGSAAAGYTSVECIAYHP